MSEKRVRTLVISTQAPDDISVGWIDISDYIKDTKNNRIYFKINFDGAAGEWKSVVDTDLTDVYRRLGIADDNIEQNSIDISNLAAAVESIKQFSYVVTDSLPEASDATMFCIYIVTQDDGKSKEYITVDKGASANPRYVWEELGYLSFDINNYYNKTEVDNKLVFEAGTGENSAQQKGSNTKATGNFSSAEGKNTTASGNASHAEGVGPSAGGKGAIGYSSHSEGEFTNAPGEASHAEGNSTSANGLGSHAEGCVSEANGGYSHAEGFRTKTHQQGEHAEGRYNISNNGSTTAKKTQHSVGIGTSENERKNAFEIMQNGDAYLFGANGYDGTNPAPNRSLQTTINNLENNKQDLLVSGTNIKTINNQSILGSGNINTDGNLIGIGSFPSDGIYTKAQMLNGWLSCSEADFKKMIVGRECRGVVDWDFDGRTYTHIGFSGELGDAYWDGGCAWFQCGPKIVEIKVINNPSDGVLFQVTWRNLWT